MNFFLVAKHLGRFVASFALVFIPAALWAVWFREWPELVAFAESSVATLAAGGVLMLIGRAGKGRLFQRESLGLVGLGWLVAAAAGATPYVFSGLLGPVDAYFETMSGLTTTGATVLPDIEGAPKSLLFWRSFTHWLGGMGIIVLFIAVLPYLGAGGKQLFKSESPGPDPSSLKPRIRDTASILWRIYVGLTVAETGLLMASGMSFYDALCHTFGTIATGGFSPRQASIGAFDSIAVETIIIVFMVFAGTNFALFFSMLRGKWTALFRDAEWRWYVALMAGATVLVALSLMAGPAYLALDESARALQPEAPGYSVPEAFRAAAFTVVSIMTTTGYVTEDFEQWPYFTQAILVALMFIGGCAGSTGGGVKVVRIVLLLKMTYWRLENTFRPKTVRTIRFNDQIIDEVLQRRVYTFLFLHLVVFVIGCLFMTALGLPLVTAVTAVIATLNNIGPGLEFVGSGHDYHLVPQAGKVFLSFCMALGRLELFSIAVLFLPGFWRHS